MSDGKCIGGGYPPTKEYDVQEGDSMKGVVLLRLYTNRFFHVRTAGRRLGRAARRTDDTPMVSGRFRSLTKERTKDLQKAVEKLAEQGKPTDDEDCLKAAAPELGQNVAQAGKPTDDGDCLKAAAAPELGQDVAQAGKPTDEGIFGPKTAPGWPGR